MMRLRNTGAVLTVLALGIMGGAHEAWPQGRSGLLDCKLVSNGAAQVVEFETYARDGSAASIHGAIILPDADGPFPAVVLLHRYFGIETPDCFKREMARYHSWGYVALLVDSNSAAPQIRSGTSDETPTNYSHTDQAADALAAVSYLGSRSDIDANHINVVGHAYGGTAVLRAVTKSGRKTLGTRRPELSAARIRAAVAWHPACPPKLLDIGVPLLVFAGGKDSLNSSNACTAMQKTTLVGVPPPKQEVFPLSGHNFDMDWSSEFDAEATALAYDAVSDFLALYRSP